MRRTFDDAAVQMFYLLVRYLIHVLFLTINTSRLEIREQDRLFGLERFAEYDYSWKMMLLPPELEVGKEGNTSLPQSLLFLTRMYLGEMLCEL